MAELMASSERQSLGEYPAGTHVAMLTSGKFLVLHNLARFEVGDGELVLTSTSGHVGSIAAGDWAGVGTLEHTDGIAWIAFEATAEVVA